jgi:hypothetical protein
MIYIKRSRYLTSAKHEELYKAASLFMTELMGRKADKVDVIISVKGTGLEDHVDGYCLCTEENSAGKGIEFELDIRGNRGLDFAIKCMAHELVHVWQMSTGRISEKQYHKTTDHYNSPWEVEARELEEPLYEMYLKS